MEKEQSNKGYGRRIEKRGRKKQGAIYRERDFRIQSGDLPLSTVTEEGLSCEVRMRVQSNIIIRLRWFHEVFVLVRTWVDKYYTSKVD